MAIKTMNPEELFLYDTMPGSESNDLSVPEGGDFGFFNGTRHHNVSSAKYRLGEKLRVYNDPGTGAGLGLQGWSTMIYLQVGAQDATDISAGSWVTQVADGDANISGGNDAYLVTNDPAACRNEVAADIAQMGAAVAISAIEDAYFGWFWCGGVCPLNWLLSSATASLLAADSIDTNDAVGIGDDLSLDGSEATIVVRPNVTSDGTLTPKSVGFTLAVSA